MGWLLAVINASDLAAAGAAPLAFLAAIEVEPMRPMNEFRRFLAGLQDSCTNEGLKYIGGNLREGPRLTSVGTAIGTVESGRMLTRRGARPGDVLVSIGQGGVFWRDALTVVRGGKLPDKRASPVFAPHSEIRAMNALTNARLIRCAIDNSDGLLPSLLELAVANSCSVILDLEALTVLKSDHLNIDPARLWLGWGDWNILAAVAPSDFEAAARAIAGLGTTVSRIGEFRNAGSEVLLRRGDTLVSSPRLESERFAVDSWFSAGIEGYIDSLLAVVLP
jgi:thiamine-monophosphate kinase